MLHVGLYWRHFSQWLAELEDFASVSREVKKQHYAHFAQEYIMLLFFLPGTILFSSVAILLFLDYKHGVHEIYQHTEKLILCTS